MKWFFKAARSDVERIEDNLNRLSSLKETVHDLGYYVFSSQSGGYAALKSLLEEKIVTGRPNIWNKLNEANIGENHQKLALDNPARFQKIMIEAENLIQHEIVKEIKKLREVKNEF